MRRPRPGRVAITVALLVAVGAALAGCSASAELRARQAAADAATAAASWDDPVVQERWSTSVVGRSPLVDPPTDRATAAVLARISWGLVQIDPEIRDDRGEGLVDYTSASDQTVETLGARSTLLALGLEPASGSCGGSDRSCENVQVTAATPTTVSAATARGTASVPAWSYGVDGLDTPLVLPAVASVASAADVAPSHTGPSGSHLLSRDGSTLQVVLFVPACSSDYRRHLLETDAAVVVWPTAESSGRECAAVMTEQAETFTLGAPVGDRPVVDTAGRVLLPPR